MKTFVNLKYIKSINVPDFSSLKMKDVIGTRGEYEVFMLSRGSNGFTGAFFNRGGEGGKVTRPCPLLWELTEEYE